MTSKLLDLKADTNNAKIKIAKNILKENIDINSIARITDLIIENIQNMK